jgi:acyl-CoA thioesterase
MQRSKPISKKFGLENYQYPDRFGKMLGYKVLKVNAKQHRVEMGLQIRKDHLSPAKRVHGGVLSAFFDISLGAAVFTTLDPYDFCSTVELKVNYFRPVEMGDMLRCKTEVVFRGKKLCVVHGFIYRNKDMKPVAMATGTFNIVSASLSGSQNGATGIPRTPKARSK